MAAAAVMTAAGCGGAGAARSLSRFRGCLAGALLGDCVGAVYEARDTVDLTSVLRRVQDLEPDPGSPGSARTEALCYTDDTAMARALVQSLLAKEAFDEMDMAHRFAQEYKKDPDRGYGAGVITVFRKLLSPKCRDVFEPARAQFNGKGSYGNGGAMRVAGISLAYSSVQDVQKFARLSAQLTHASSLGYNGAILQALAVHLALQGESSSEHFLEQLLGHMEELESDAQSVSDARELGMEERPYSSRLKKIGELLEQDSVTREEVVSELECFTSRMSFHPCTSPARIPNFIHSLHEELNPGYRNHTASRSASWDLNPGNGIAAFESVPTAIYCFLRCMEPDPEIPSAFNSLQRTLIYSISLGGDTDTIATMAGAIAGAYYGMEQVPESWQQSCEGYEETDVLAQSLHRVFQKNL
ncbi:ADP-ribosylhydrolase ARH3 isoform X1 [Lagenorhynchus albirostris]|uniref:ADP-ribosylhydrolase ARH3 isoform X1 n=1 Tax=Lagenorhynchus albirostris TaxID=27610 RepID=UPI0028E70164|nr:ADP-ribosylhydrolase ARH3 isoform X1 [Lagenorhynchus albirostris]